MSDETNDVTEDVTDDVTNDVAAVELDEVVSDVMAAAPSAPSGAPVAAVKAATTDEADASRTNPRKIREGVVISDKMNSTLVVAVHERVRHPRYDKTVQRTKKLYVHDEKNEAKIGDKVRVQETRPLSKLKRWRLTEIVERAR